MREGVDVGTLKKFASMCEFRKRVGPPRPQEEGAPNPQSNSSGGGGYGNNNHGSSSGGGHERGRSSRNNVSPRASSSSSTISRLQSRQARESPAPAASSHAERSGGGASSSSLLGGSGGGNDSHARGTASHHGNYRSQAAREELQRANRMKQMQRLEGLDHSSSHNSWSNNHYGSSSIGGGYGGGGSSSSSTFEALFGGQSVHRTHSHAGYAADVSRLGDNSSLVGHGTMSYLSGAGARGTGSSSSVVGNHYERGSSAERYAFFCIPVQT